MIAESHFIGVTYLFFPNIEKTLVQGKLLAVVPRLSAEWTLVYSLNVKSLQTTSMLCSFVHLSILTDDTSGAIYGSRSPFHYLERVTQGLQGKFEKMKFGSAINSATAYITMSEMPEVGEWEHYEFHQRYVSGGNYRFFVKRNGEEVYSAINTDAQQFYNVKVYAGSPTFPACAAEIKNLELTNFL